MRNILGKAIFSDFDLLRIEAPRLHMNSSFQVGLFGWSGVTIRSSSSPTIYTSKRDLLTDTVAQLFLGKHDWDILTTVGEREYYFKVALPHVFASYAH